MAITFADVPLLLEDPGGEFRGWLDRYLDLADLRLFAAEPPAFRSKRTGARGSGMAKVGLPVPNWPAPPRMKINTLWWPSGASRFAFGLFLAHDQAVQQIRTAVAGSNGRGLLKFSEISSDSDRTDLYDLHPPEIETEMHLLAPRRLTRSKNGIGGWLLPLVDVRYFWQFRDAGTLLVDEDTSWEQIYDELAGQLSEVIEYDSIDAGYYRPDSTELTRQYENIALLLDAVAACVGHRIVRKYNGTVQSQSCTAARSVLYDNLPLERGADALGAVEVAGGRSTATAEWDAPVEADLQGGADLFLPHYGLIPSEIEVVFPRASVLGVPQSDGDVFALTISGGLYTTTTQEPGTVKTIFDSAQAEFTDATSDLPINLTALENLSDQIATDYYAWLQEPPYDTVYAGIASTWTPCGFDDAIWIHFGYRNPVGGYAAQTRITALPLNFGVDEMLHGSDVYSSASVSDQSSTSKSSPSSSTSSSSTSSSSTSSTSSSSASSPSSSQSSTSSMGSSDSSTGGSSDSSAGSSDSSTGGSSASSELMMYSSASSSIVPDGPSLDVVTDVFCEDNDIVVCTVEIFFPLGTTFGPEECGDEAQSQSSTEQQSSESSGGASDSSGGSSDSSTGGSNDSSGGSSDSSTGGSSDSSLSSRGSSDSSQDGSSDSSTGGSSASSPSSSPSSSLSSSSTSSYSPSSSSSGGCCLIVTGTMIPDVTGLYCPYSESGGRTAYACGSWYIWYDEEEEMWVLSDQIGGGQDPDDYWWEGELEDPDELFNSAGDAVGAAYVQPDPDCG